MPYTWLNSVLMSLGFAAFIGAVAFVAVAIWRGKGRRKRPLLAAGCCLVAFLLLGTANYAVIFLVQLPSVGRQIQRVRQERVDAVSLVRVGDRAPSFRLQTIGGSEFAMDELRGKVVVLTFFATWCGPCLMELPHIQALWNEHGQRKDFALLVIGREESDPSVRAFMAEHGYSFPAAADPERSIYSLFAKELIPRTYLIASDGTICRATTGFDEVGVRGLKRELVRQFGVTD